MISHTRTALVTLLAASAASVFAVAAAAQVQEKTTTQTGTPTKEVKVERGEVVHISGNDLVVKMEDGQIRDFPNIPDSARVTVDGKELSVHDLKPGMKLQRTITTTSTPKIVTTVQSVTGTVFQVHPPSSVILTLEDGTHQQFSIPKGQKFTLDNGEQGDAFSLRKGMKITATKIVEVPETYVTQQRSVTGQIPPPPSPPPADIPILVAVVVPNPAPAPSSAAPSGPTSEAAPSRLPTTGSNLPLLGFLGAFVRELRRGRSPLFCNKVKSPTARGTRVLELQETPKTSGTERAGPQAFRHASST